jgi:hypothetical protein
MFCSAIAARGGAVSPVLEAARHAHGALRALKDQEFSLSERKRKNGFRRFLAPRGFRPIPISTSLYVGDDFTRPQGAPLPLWGKMSREA